MQMKKRLFGRMSENSSSFFVFFIYTKPSKECKMVIFKKMEYYGTRL